MSRNAFSTICFWRNIVVSYYLQCILSVEPHLSRSYFSHVPRKCIILFGGTKLIILKKQTSLNLTNKVVWCFVCLLKTVFGLQFLQLYFKNLVEFNIFSMWFWFIQTPGETTVSTFHQQVLLFWKLAYLHTILHLFQFGTTNIRILHRNKPLCFKNWLSRIWSVRDLMDKKGNLLNYNAFTLKIYLSPQRVLHCH